MLRTAGPGILYILSALVVATVRATYFLSVGCIMVVEASVLLTVYSFA
jgi:hypothetical protein